MWQDPIIKETRELREDYASKFKNDPDAIFEDILKRQKTSKTKYVIFLPRKPKAEKKVA
ncbi:MAG: hypothetical protein HQK63_17280 [Desulfamplus sp.]|nr:hypothetical protein [Desulfamplus sp.]